MPVNRLISLSPLVATFVGSVNKRIQRSLVPRVTLAAVCALSVAACSGGGSTSSSLPAQAVGSATNAGGSTSTNASTKGAFTVSGVVEDLSNASQPLIQAGANCGYLYINVASSTKVITDGSTLAVGKYVESVGTGSCATSATATTLYVAASAAGLAALTGTISAPPIPATFTVSGVVQDVSNPNQPLIQAGAGCGYLYVNINSSTKVITDGSTLAVGRYAESVGSGSCATSATATTLYVAASAKSLAALAAASPAPVPSQTTAPVLSPTTPVLLSGMNSANYTSIVNGQSWPLSFQPNCVNASYQASAPCPYNDALPNPDSPAHVYASSSTIISAMNNAGDLEFGFWAGEGGGSIPVYLASTSDPVVTVSCTSYCQSRSVSIHVPSQARPAPAICPGDCLMGVIQADGTEYAMYGMNPAYSGGSTITAVGLAYTSVVSSNGVDPNGESFAYPGNGGGDVGNGSMFAAMADSITVAELNAGVIPHVLHWNVACGTGQVFPGSTNDQCSQFGYSGPPAGSRFQLTLTDAQINALSAAPWEKTILRALHDYGAIADVTCPRLCGDRINLYTESQEQYSAYGTTWPVSAFNWASPSNNGGIGSVPTHWQPAGVNWSTMLRILDPCYSMETCTS